MIDFDYSNGQIKITTGDLSKVFKKDQLPLEIKIKKVISKEEVWTTKLDNFMWATYPENEINDIVVNDKNGNFVYRYYWDVMKHGSIFYKSMWLYCKGLLNEGKKPRGLVIGTHDGEFGEWVPIIRDFMGESVLVEGSEKQYNKLLQNYRLKPNVNCLFDIITPDGEEVEFFEGGKGYTNSVVERVIRGWEKEEIHSTKRKSTSINDLIESNSLEKMDWLHLDVEGLDVKLLMAMKKEYLPNFIIFEDFNLLPDEKVMVDSYFKQMGYNLHSEAGICMLTKN